MEQFSSILLFEPKFDHLIPYENESKSLRRATGQDPLKGTATLKASASQMQVLIKSCNMPQTLS